MTAVSQARPAPRPDLAEVLSGRLGVQALRRLLVEPLEGPGGAPGGVTGDGPAVLLRSKYKPGRKLTGYYRSADGESFTARTWTADGGTSELRSPADPLLPQLRTLRDPAHLSALLADLAGEPVCGSPHDLAVRTVRYRPGQRHVLHVRGGHLEPPGVYLKLDRDASGACAVPVAIDLAGRLPVPAPLGYAESTRVAAWQGVPGRPLGPALRGRSTEGPRLVHRVGQGLRALHDSPVLVDRSHSVAVEARTTLRAAEHLTALLPSEGHRVRTVVETVLGGLDRWSAEPPTLGHGDVKCDNLVAGDDRRVWFLDLDRVAVQEPALDLAKLLADLRWWCPDPWFPVLRDALRAGYGACDPARWARADLLAGLLGAKLVARRCAVHDPAWTRTVGARLGRVTGALQTVGAEA